MRMSITSDGEHLVRHSEFELSPTQVEAVRGFAASLARLNLTPPATPVIPAGTGDRARRRQAEEAPAAGGDLNATLAEMCQRLAVAEGRLRTLEDRADAGVEGLRKVHLKLGGLKDAADVAAVRVGTLDQYAAGMNVRMCQGDQGLDVRLAKLEQQARDRDFATLAGRINAIEDFINRVKTLVNFK